MLLLSSFLTVNNKGEQASRGSKCKPKGFEAPKSLDRNLGNGRVKVQLTALAE